MTLLMTRPKKGKDCLSLPEESCRLKRPADALRENLGNHRCHDDVGCEEEDDLAHSCTRFPCYLGMEI